MLRNSDFGRPLHVKSLSPVRGQLEPQDLRLKPGCRYIQCTDTPGELKVLLPARTAYMYGQLLKAELYALKDPHFIDWNRLVEIRHLKDRMIRKCMRLSGLWQSNKRHMNEPKFATVTAPETFRLKELEQWVQNEQSRAGAAVNVSKTSVVSDVSRKASICCDRCSRSGGPHESLSPMSSRTSSQSSFSPMAQSPQIPSALPGWSSGGSPTPNTPYKDPQLPSGTVEVNIESQSLPSDLSRRACAEALPRDTPAKAEEAGKQPDFLVKPPSPEPLPHPFRQSLSQAVPRIVITRAQDELSDEDGTVCASPPLHEDGCNDVSDDPGSSTVVRRSSLKRVDSSSRLSGHTSSKAVAWAMDKDLADQMSKREAALEEIELADQEYEEIRETCAEQLLEIRNLRQTVSLTLKRLENETMRLRHEDALMQEKEEKLRDTFERLEWKQTEYRAKGRPPSSAANGVGLTKRS